MASVAAWVLGLVGCAGGDSGRQTGGDTGGDDISSEEVTNDTIDPSTFSSSLATETASSGPSDTSAETTAGSSSDPSGPSTGSVDGPTVVMVTPADETTGVDPDATITVTFSEAMDPASITADDGACRGVVQLSADDFASCAPLSASVDPEDGDTTFTLAPAAGLESASTYRVRVTASATAADGAPLGAEFTSDGFTSRYFHTIEVDGVDDWNGDEGLATSTDGHVAHIAWDDSYVYVGMRSPDVAIANGSVWVVFYFGGDGGSTEGVLANTQQPGLPFDARWHLRWRADNILTEVLEYGGAGWMTGGWEIGLGDVYRQGELLELRIARSDLADPDILEFHAGIQRDAMLDEASWAASPEGSYVDGYNPDYDQFWSFDLLGSDSPAQHVPQP